LWETFNRIVERCKEKEANLLLIAGDLFEDEYCTIGDIKRINSKFKEIKDTRVVIVAGNHDTLGRRSLYRLIKWQENVHIFENNEISKIEFDDINTVIWGISWDKKEERRNLIDNIKISDRNRINILLVHGDIFNKDSEYLPIDKSSLINSGFDYIALGHIHKPQMISSNIGYCGSPEPLDFGETGSHGIIEGKISKGNVEMVFNPFSKRIFIIKELLVDENMDYEMIINSIINCDSEEMKKEHLYRVILNGVRDRDISIELDDLYQILKDKFNYIELIDETKPDYDLEKLYRENTDNIIGYFIKEMEEKGIDNIVVKEALYSGLEVLLSEKVRK